MLDLWLLLPASFLAVLGNTILSSVSPSSFPQHFIYLGAALAVFILFSRIDIRVLKEFSPMLFVLCLAFLAFTLLFGAFSRGATRWISLGFITIQPSELVKPFVVLFFANLVSGRGTRRFLLAVSAFIPAFLLVFLQPDLGSSLIILAGFLGVLFLGGIPLWLIGAGGAGTIVSFPLIWHFLKEFQKERILSFLSPGSDPQGAGYNSLQAVISVGSGGLTGRGLGQGTQSQLAFLPERHTDFIFSSLSEELGFLGAFLVILAFCVLLYRIVDILRRTHDVFVQAFLGGVFFVIFFQAAINIGMNIGLLPITGIPLPLVSSGGSSLIATGVMLGMVSSIASSLKKS